MSQHACPRCGSEYWTSIDYGGCSECRPLEERAAEDAEAAAVTPDAPKYVLRGGPLDGQLVDPPPGFLHEFAEGIAGAFGREAGTPRVAAEGWVYEFSTDEAGVLIGREATPAELEVEKAFAPAWEEIREEERVAARMRQLSPLVLGALKAADSLLEGNGCVATSHGDVAIFVARGATAAAWREAIEQLGPRHGARPEEVPDGLWDAIEVVIRPEAST